MVKKNKNRQRQESPSIQNGGDSAESCDQKKTSVSGGRCTHIQKAVHLASVKKSLKNGCLAADCPGCAKDAAKNEGEEGTVQSSGLWLCLQCGHQGCGRMESQHALKHFRVDHSDPHCMAVNTTTWEVWCYSCEVEMDSECHKKLHECVKYLKNVDCPASVRVTAKSYGVEKNKEAETSENPPMPLADVTNMPHGMRTPKKKMISLPRVRGLQNLGNTCFFNSVLQCLAQTPHFLELLQETKQGSTRFCLPGGRGLLPQLEGKPEEQEEEEEDEELPALEGNLAKWGALTETLSSILEELRQDDATAVNPQRLLNKFTTKCPQFGGGDQHDAHELLRHLLDEVRTEDLKRYWTAILDHYGLSRHDTNETVDDHTRTQVRAYGRQASELPLLPDPVFRGILVSTVECQDCLHSYQRTEPFYELSLPVTTNKPQPPAVRRKACGDDSFDVCGNLTSDTPSKHQLKKERRQQRKGRKKQQPVKGARVLDLSNGEPPIAEEAHNTAESEQSDADVEDNVEQELSRTGEIIVNGEIVPALDLKLCNGSISGDETPQKSRTASEKKAEDTCLCNGDLSSTSLKLCNGIDGGKEALDESSSIFENVVDKENMTGNEYMQDKEQAAVKVKFIPKISEVNKENINIREKFKDKVVIKECESAEENETVKENNKTGITESEVIDELVKENGITDESEVVKNNIAVDSNEPAIENKPLVTNDILSDMDTRISNDVSSTVVEDGECKEEVNGELSLSICTAVNSPCALTSPASNTGSPSSVSSELNVDLNTTNHLPSGSWVNEDADRPFSRIAFCNDDEPVTSNLDNQQTVSLVPESSFNGCKPKTACNEDGSKDVLSGDQLAKEMAGLSLGHDECQSPSHWDTCSAHSLEDMKEGRAAPPLEVPLCNGMGKCSDTEPADDGDKSATLAPRYHCGDKECSIESCLNQFTLLELMTGSCKVICESCSERINKGKEGKMVATNSTKQYLVSNPPAVLVLHLKRFEVHQNMFRKTPRHVTFPMLLDIAPICNIKCRELPTFRRGQTKVLYSLYGVVQHSGSLHGGHYSAYVKVRAPVKRDDVRWCFLPTSQSSQKLEEASKGASVPTEPLPGKWYHVSDSRVNEVNEDRVLHSQAYLLFYERVW